METTMKWLNNTYISGENVLLFKNIFNNLTA